MAGVCGTQPLIIQSLEGMDFALTAERFGGKEKNAAFFCQDAMYISAQCYSIILVDISLCC